jgi:hypothetical protein
MMRLVGAELPFARARDLLGRLTGGSRVSTSTVRRHTEAAGEEILARQSTEMAVSWRAREEETVCAALDGCMVLTRQDGWREVKVGEIHGRGDGRRVHYVGDLGGPRTVGHLMRRSLMGLRVGTAKKQVALGDGAAWIWNVFRDVFDMATQVVDYYHVAEQIHSCGNILYGEGAMEAGRWAKRLKGIVWQKGPGALEGAIRRTRAKGNVRQKALRSLAGYVENNYRRMDYPAFREAGLPTGSGPVESACKNLVQMRLKRPGCRWNRRSVRQMVALRSAILSHTFLQESPQPSGCPCK